MRRHQGAPAARRAISLVELLVVLVILAAVAAAALASLSSASETAADRAAGEELASLARAGFAAAEAERAELTVEAHVAPAVADTPLQLADSEGGAAESQQADAVSAEVRVVDDELLLGLAHTYDGERCVWLVASRQRHASGAGTDGMCAASEAFAGRVEEAWFASSVTAAGGDRTFEFEAADGALYQVHEFTSVGESVLTVADVSGDAAVEVLVVGGGGGGGYRHGAGGGAGGLQFAALDDVEAGDYLVEVGAGGDGATDANTPGRSGEPSQFGDEVTAAGGGGAGQTNINGSVDDVVDGLDGGSGGGAAGQTGTPGDGVDGQGHPGGAGTTGSQWNHGGGGGAGGPGETGTSATIGDGGVGQDVSAWFGDDVGQDGWFAGGGGGGSHDPTPSDGQPGAGGQGGGGDGGEPGVGSRAGDDGMDGTGGGGGGASTSSGGSGHGGDGGDGVVLVRYLLEPAP